MLEPMKEHYIEARFKGPPEKIEELTRFSRTLGLDESTDSLPWQDLFTDLDDEPSYSVALKGARGKEGLTQKELAKKAGIPRAISLQ